MNGDLPSDGKRHSLVLDEEEYYKNVVILALALTITHEEMDLFTSLFESLLIRCGVINVVVKGG